MRIFYVLTSDGKLLKPIHVNVAGDSKMERVDIPLMEINLKTPLMEMSNLMTVFFKSTIGGKIVKSIHVHLLSGLLCKKSKTH